MTDKPKRTVNRNSELGIGAALDRLIALNASQAQREKEAIETLRHQLDEHADRIMLRVPVDLRPRVVTMLIASGEADLRDLGERLRARLGGSLGIKPVTIEAGPIELKQSEPSDVIDAEYEDPAVPPAQPAPAVPFRAAVAAVADALPEEELPKGAATPYEPTQRLTGRARAK